MKIEYKRLGERDRELFLGHMVTWGSIVTGLIVAITLTHFSAPEPEEDASPARAESPSLQDDGANPIMSRPARG